MNAMKPWMAAAAMVTLTAAAQAGPVAGVSISGITAFCCDGPWTMGYRFTALNNITVTALGAFDSGGDGFRNNHAVGLWTTGGTLLASTTVTSANALTGNFRYASIAGFALTADVDYIVGAADFGGDGQDDYASATVLSAPDIRDVGSRYGGGDGLTFPSGICYSTDLYIAGNFLYDAPATTVPDPTTTVPEPATLPLLCAALAGLFLSRRRHAKSS